MALPLFIGGNKMEQVDHDLFVEMMEEEEEQDE